MFREVTTWRTEHVAPVSRTSRYHLALLGASRCSVGRDPLREAQCRKGRSLGVFTPSVTACPLGSVRHQSICLRVVVPHKQWADSMLRGNAEAGVLQQWELPVRSGFSLWGKHSSQLSEVGTACRRP